ncbi:hypothetical protein CHUAL_012712 [Chamberlinius hualienensis]
MGELLSIFWPSHAQQLSDGMWKCLQECFKTDFVISVTKNDGVQRLVKAHYLMLSIFCPSIKNSDERILEFDSLSNFEEEDMKYLLEFIYKGKTTIPINRISQIKDAAKLLGLKVLLETIENCKVNNETTTEKDKEEKLPIKQDNITDNPQPKKAAKFISRLKKQHTHNANFTTINNPVIFSKRKRNVKPGSTEGPSSGFTSLQNNSSFDTITQTCQLCDKRFSNRNAFRRHIRCHIEPNTMQHCPHCPAKFPNGKQIASHVALKHQMDMDGNLLEKKYKCDECDFSSVYQSSIKNHKVYKHGEKAQKCDQCSYSCHNYADLLQHKDGVHSELRPYMCDHCGFRAKTKSSIRLHLTMHQEKIPCDICGALYKYRALNRHKRNIHCADKKAFACQLCSYATSCKSYLQTHLTKVHKVVPQNSSKTKNIQQQTPTESTVMS